MPESRLFVELHDSLTAVDEKHISALPFLDVCRLVLPVIGTSRGHMLRILLLMGRESASDNLAVVRGDQSMACCLASRDALSFA